MKISEIEISPEVFFKVGIWCFLIIAFMNIGNFFYTLQHHNFFTSVSAWANIFFNFVLAGFFFYLFKQANPQVTEEFASDDIDDLIEQVKKQEKKSEHLRTKTKN